MTIPRVVRSTMSVAAGAVMMTTLQAPPAHAVDLGFHVRGELVNHLGGYAIACAAFFDDPVAYPVVVATTLVSCWNPGPDGVSAPDVFLPGPVAATGMVALGPRSSNTVCAQGIFTYVDPVTATVKQYDTGVQCDAVNLLA